MTYGTTEGITLLTGGVTEYISAANITAAIVMSDIKVDAVNSSAAANIKTLASNEIAAEILLYGSSNSMTEGLDSEGSTQGSPSRKARITNGYGIPDSAYMLLTQAGGSISYITQGDETA